MSNKLFCFGYGYSALELAKRLRERGWAISGTIRPSSEGAGEKAGRLRALGYEVHFLDHATALDDPAEILGDVTHIVVSTPPGTEGDVALALHRTDIAAMKKLQWLGYLSTTGVYGTRDGGTVTEEDPLHPSMPRSQARADAEAAWMQLRKDSSVPVHLFRLAGIYGPGRNVLRKIRAGKVEQRIDRPGQVFSRIHVEDIATVLEASIRKPRPGGIYNVCDDAPEEPSIVTEYACRLLGAPVPELVPFEQAEMSPMAQTFWNDNKRVDNSLIKTELGVELRYPDYQTGFQALLSTL
ncbi:SDR family oxidoreductase [Kiloniella sp. b19]|uniref:SDR family oxidoreductase n=1 Tax=Kiloniella sp. GXU_MW_B19 TaxID=3141326 RepID=UPI0031DDFB8E